MLIENLRHSIVGEHGQLADIVKLSKTFALELSIDISYQNLSSFIKVDLVPLIDRVILEVGKILGQDSQHLDC